MSLGMSKIFSHMGEPFYIEPLSTWSIIRNTPVKGVCDIMANYPVLPIYNDIASLRDGIEYIKKEIPHAASFTFVSDPFYGISSKQLSFYLDYYSPFKTHYFYDNRLSNKQFTKHHRYEVRRSLDKVNVKIDGITNRERDLFDIYKFLVSKHKITGILNYDISSFKYMAQVNGFVLFNAYDYNNKIESFHIWAETNDYAYSFLAASTDIGYKLMASYAIYDTAVKHFDNKKVISFGGGAGLREQVNCGLSRFKEGFSNSYGKSYVCGKILSSELYYELCKSVPTKRGGSSYFPLYRGG